MKRRDKVPSAETTAQRIMRNNRNDTWARHGLYRDLFPWFGPEFARAAGLEAPADVTEMTTWPLKKRQRWLANHGLIGTPGGPNVLRAIWLRANEEWKRLFWPLRPLGDPAAWEAALLAAGVPREELVTLDHYQAAERIRIWAQARLANRPVEVVAREQELIVDGPIEGNRFRWNHQIHNLQPILWKLLNAMWGHDSRDRNDVEQQVWAN